MFAFKGCVVLTGQAHATIGVIRFGAVAVTCVIRLVAMQQCRPLRLGVADTW
jgi:hypothetical protein